MNDQQRYQAWGHDANKVKANKSLNLRKSESTTNKPMNTCSFSIGCLYLSWLFDFS